MRCIICKEIKEQEEFNEEHVFPDSIGGTLTQYNVCIICNSRLGHDVDTHLVNHFLVKIKRMIYRIPGKSGEIPNIFKKGYLKGDMEQEMRLEFDSVGNSKGVYMQPEKQFNVLADGSGNLHYRVDLKDKARLPGMVNKTLKRNGFPVMESAEILRRAVETREPAPEMIIEASADLIEYKRAILKIAYELSHYWIGENYFNDPNGEIIRKILIAKNFTDAKINKIGSINEGISLDLYKRLKQGGDFHMAVLIKDGNKIYCEIQIFDCMEGTIIVSNNAERYPDFVNRFISINPVTGEKLESTLTDAFKRLAGERV
ncbi:HNH endonuclease [Planococcus beijingensis]|uniref:HNH endonuclease n=1 Tax=Planococcus beijingensis TaxID=2782551 RepID=UPI00193AE5B0|nr:HNH endonuclease [Planococcus beijingensis]